MSLLSDLGTKIGTKLKELQTAINGKLDSNAKAADSNLLDGLDSTSFLRRNIPTQTTASITVDTPADYDSDVVTGLTSAPIIVPEVNVGSESLFLPFLHQKALYSSGYRTHMNLGLKKGGGSWGNDTNGFYIALGGNDSYPTKNFLMTFGGDIKHSDGHTFYHSGNLPSSSANYAFWAYHTSGVATSTVNTPIVFNATQTNNNSVYNTTNGRFTAPVSGTYYLEGNLLYRGTSVCEWSFYRNGVNTGSRGTSYTGGVAAASTPHLNAPSSLIIYLNVGDYVDMRIYQIGGGDYYYGQRLAHFAGYLMS